MALVQRRCRRVRLWVVWEWVRVGREGWAEEVGGRRGGVEGEVRREAVRMERWWVSDLTGRVGLVGEAAVGEMVWGVFTLGS